MKTPKIIVLVMAMMCFAKSFAQTGIFTAVFTIENGQTSSINISKPILKYDDPNGYWMINPHNGERHFSLSPDRNYGSSDAAFIDLNGSQNDFDLYYERDSTHISFSNKKYGFLMPELSHDGKSKPLHIHINLFTNAEISFTISGNMLCQENKDGAPVNNCTINGSGHFYREAKFLQTALLPGCNCDASVYAKVFDEENNIRSASQCEVAFKNKVFNAMQQTFAPVLANVGSHANGKMAAGDISVIMLPGRINIDVPARDADYCNTQNQQGFTNFNAQKFYYNNEDGYGLRLIRIPTDEELNGGNNISATEEFTKKFVLAAAKSDSLFKLYTAKKITLEEYQEKVNQNTASLSMPATSSNDAFEIAKVETNLNIEVFLNPVSAEMMLMKVSDKNKTIVQHNISGAAFEIFSPSAKDDDGTYMLNKKFIYFGKFTTPVNGKSTGGFDAKVTKAIYPENGNKLSVYNIIIRLEGSADMIEKAVANINFEALEKLITQQ